VIDWGHVALRRDQLVDSDLGQILREVEAGKPSEWKNIADHNPIYEIYGDKRKSLVQTVGVLERHWESADETTKTTQIYLPGITLKKYWYSSMEDLQEDISLRTQSYINSSNVTTWLKVVCPSVAYFTEIHNVFRFAVSDIFPEFTCSHS
jgi:hypothetical protein